MIFLNNIGKILGNNALNSINNTSNITNNEGVGYNLKYAIDTMKTIESQFKNLGNYLSENWNSVVNVLRVNWVGIDEQGFEQKLSEKIKLCYKNSSDLTQQAINNVQKYANDWIEAQQKNVLGELNDLTPITNMPEYIELQEGITITPLTDVAEFKKIEQYDPGTNFGLMSSSSAAIIKAEITRYVQDIQKRTSNVFSEVPAILAFFGQQTITIQNFIYKVSQTIGILSTAIQDLYDALDLLAKSNYETAEGNLTTNLETVISDIEENIESLESSKWDTTN